MWISFSTSPSISRETGMPGPLGDDLGDVLLGDLLGQHRAAVAMELSELRLLLATFFSSSGMRAVAQLRGALEVRVALGALGLALTSSSSALADLIWSIAPFSFCQRAFISDGALAQVGQLGLDRVEALLRGLVLLLLQGLALDLELLDAALHLVDLGGHRVDLDLQPRGGLVDQVDRLVGQEAIGDVAVGEGRRGDDRRVRDADAVVDLVALLEAAEDRDGVGGVGSPTKIGWKRRSSAASFSMCLRYSSSVVAPTARSSPRASIGFKEVGGVDAPSAVPAPTIVWSSSMKRTIWPSAAWISLRTALSRSSNSPRYLEPASSAPMSSAITRRSRKRLRNVAGDDPLGEALDDRGLADAGVADQHRVVLRAPREDLDDAADLLVAADDRVELADSASAVRSRPYFSSAPKVSSGLGEVTRCGPRTSEIACDEFLAGREKIGDPGLGSESASRMCSVEMYSSPRPADSFSACCSTQTNPLEGRMSGTVLPLSFGSLPIASRTRPRASRASTPSRCSTGTTTPSSCSSRAKSRWARSDLGVGVLRGEPLRGRHGLL